MVNASLVAATDEPGCEELHQPVVVALQNLGIEVSGAELHHLVLATTTALALVAARLAAHAFTYELLRLRHAVVHDGLGVAPALRSPRSPPCQ